jgi:uncharacterized cupin superfamily protein
MKNANIFDPQFEEASERPEGWRWRYARLGPVIGAEKMGATVYELPPGARSFPYHYEYPEEEWLICLAGNPTLRTPEGERRLEPGDVACFPPGPRGAHQFRNDTDEPVRVMMLSTMSFPAVAFYPDSGKVLVVPERGGEGRALFRVEDSVDYWEGEA